MPVLAKVWSATVVGVDGRPIEVEVDIAPGLPGLTIVGLPDTAVQESRERVRSAIRHSGFEYPLRRITVNLAPASLRKGGAAYDLAIAVAILAASGQIPQQVASGALLVGELALDGRLRPVRGVMPMVADLCQGGFERVVVPWACASEARLAASVPVIAAHDLAGAVAALRGDEAGAARTGDPSAGDACEDGEARATARDAGNALQAGEARAMAADPRDARNGADAPQAAKSSPDVEACTTMRVPGASIAREEQHDLSDVAGQGAVRRALEVAAAGEHNLLLVGPPGSGKTMLAERMPGILPPLTAREAVEVARVQSVAGTLVGAERLPSARPFRAVHHSASTAALVGGGPGARPGEVTLAHRGVLFLDELPEFRREVIEGLRQPLEDGAITVARAQAVHRYPAAFLLVAAMNPCPCGYLGDRVRPCTCGTAALERYRQRVSGPLLDRFDLHVEVARLAPDQLLATVPGEPSARVRARVLAARERQTARLCGTGHATNARMSAGLVRTHCRVAPSQRDYLQRSAQALGLSARGLTKVLKVARTIADLAGSESIERSHLAEAVGYRALDCEPPCARAA